LKIDVLTNANSKQAAAWTPPELQNKSIVIPRKKLDISIAYLFPLTG
jgi:hypothetical protein